MSITSNQLKKLSDTHENLTSDSKVLFTNKRKAYELFKTATCNPALSLISVDGYHLIKKELAALKIIDERVSGVSITPNQLKELSDTHENLAPNDKALFNNRRKAYELLKNATCDPTLSFITADGYHLIKKELAACKQQDSSDEEEENKKKKSQLEKDVDGESPPKKEGEEEEEDKFISLLTVYVD